MDEPELTVRDHPAAFVAWVVAAASTLAAATAASIGPHDEIPWDAALFPLMFSVPGAMIAARLPRELIGWLMLAIGAWFSSIAVGTQWLSVGTDSAAASWWAWWVGRGGGAMLVPATLLLVLLLPDGHLPSKRWRPIVVATIGAQVIVLTIACFTQGPASLDVAVPGAEGLSNPIGFLPEAWNDLMVAVVDPLLTIPFLLGIASVVARLRSGDSDARPRIVGVLAGVVLFVLLVTVPDLAWPSASRWFHVCGAALLSGSILIAVLRGAYERLEVAVARALLYGFLTVIVAAAYVGLIALTASLGVPDRFAGALTGLVALSLLPARTFMQAVLRRIVYGAQQPHAEALAAAPTAAVPGEKSLLELSRRENEILRLVARGMTNAEIAAELFISPITVRNHVSAILTKLGVKNRTQAVVRFTGS